MINGLAESEYLEIVTISKLPLLLADERSKGALPLVDPMVTLHSASLHITQFSFITAWWEFPPAVNPLEHVENAFYIEGEKAPFIKWESCYFPINVMLNWEPAMVGE